MFTWLTVALSHPFKKDCQALPLSIPLSSRRSMVWCPWLCACLSSPQHYRFPGQHIQFSKVDVGHTHMPVWVSHCTSHFMWHAHWICEDDGMCSLTQWLSPLEAIQAWRMCVTKSLHLHCQAGGWEHIGCTVFMDGGCTLLDSEAPPDITTGLKTKY